MPTRTDARDQRARARPAHDAHRRVYRHLGGTASDPAFRVLGWQVHGEVVELRFGIDGLAELTETFTVTGLDLEVAVERPAVRGALDLLLLAAASSYYKICVPPRVVLPPVPAAAATMVQALLTDGLAEFAAGNGFALHDHIAVVAEGPVDDAAPLARPEGVLVPIGGGKDSAVTAALARERGLDAVAFALNPRRSMTATAESTGLDLLAVTRTLDPQVATLNAAGALNGHVPVTAIVASAAVLAATVTGRGDVLLSNESSADEPTRHVDGRPVNHQYSKSSAFEALHREATTALTGGASRAISVLRPVPELLVARLFAILDRRTPLLEAVNSCNRAYALSGDGAEWCGRCPKCLFVQLMLAPFVDADRLRARLGFDALDDPERLDDLGALLDPERKPYECVGTVAEVQLAFDLLADDEAWADHLAVRRFGTAGADASTRLATMIAEVDTTALPTRYGEPIAALLDTEHPSP